MPVKYKLIEGYEGYRACSDGSIWSCWGRDGNSKAILTTSWKKLAVSPPEQRKYPAVALRVSPYKCHTRSVHKLILEAFRGPAPVVKGKKLEARHIDGNVRNTALYNLKYGTHIQNMRDQKRHGTDPVGSRNGNHTLHEDDVVEIRKLLACGISQRKIARIFGVVQTTISLINRGMLWKHVIAA